jgi:hypothetical protein
MGRPCHFSPAPRPGTDNFRRAFQRAGLPGAGWSSCYATAVAKAHYAKGRVTAGAIVTGGPVNSGAS